MQEELIQFYSNDYDEAGRLLKDRAHWIEFLTTMDVLKRLIRPGACILDCCAGAGAYPLLWRPKAIRLRRVI